MRKTQKRTNCDVTTDKDHTVKIYLYEGDGTTYSALCPKKPLIFNARVNWPRW